MKPYISENFLLHNSFARELYHAYAAEMPIFDYHTHLPVTAISENRQFKNLTEIWLAGDHYKWRAMRANGIDEQYITGSASDYEKFGAWAATVPKTLRNPLYHWTHMELKKPFGISDRLLNSDSAPEIYKTCSAMLQGPDFSPQGILKQMNVRVICTTDDPLDNLEPHQKLREVGNGFTKVLPAFRPDRAMGVEKGAAFYNRWVDGLAEVADREINCFSDLLEALKTRHDYFHQRGCRIADHGIDRFYHKEAGQREIDRIFKKIRGGIDLDPEEIAAFKTATLLELARLNAEKSWVQQLHIGALRNTNSRMMHRLGPDSGYDSINDQELALPLAKFLDRLEQTGQLSKTILYNLNPRDNEMIATMIGNFQDGSVPGKIQYGSGWWFNDQKDGIERQVNALSNMGLLSRFVGMLTDSRSFLSYSRHEYFRRILCNLLGEDIEKGLLPEELTLIGRMVEDICYHNAVSYFAIEGV